MFVIIDMSEMNLDWDEEDKTQVFDRAKLFEQMAALERAEDFRKFAAGGDFDDEIEEDTSPTLRSVVIDGEVKVRGQRAHDEVNVTIAPSSYARPSRDDRNQIEIELDTDFFIREIKDLVKAQMG